MYNTVYIVHYMKQKVNDWCPRMESNHELCVRSALFYPLNYGGRIRFDTDYSRLYDILIMTTRSLHHETITDIVIELWRHLSDNLQQFTRLPVFVYNTYQLLVAL